MHTSLKTVFANANWKPCDVCKTSQILFFNKMLFFTTLYTLTGFLKVGIKQILLRATDQSTTQDNIKKNSGFKL